MAVSRPILYRKITKKSRVLVGITILILVSLTSSAPLFLAAKTECVCDDIKSKDGSGPSAFSEWYIFDVCFQIIRAILPLTLSLFSYIGIFLAARNLRNRELARKKVLDEIETKKVGRSTHQKEVEDESGIDMIETSSVQSEDDRGLIRSHSTSSSMRKSIVFNNNIIINSNNNVSSNNNVNSNSNLSSSKNCTSGNNLNKSTDNNSSYNNLEFRKSLKFSNTAVFLDTLNSTFFTSNLMEELNLRHEDYFSLSQTEDEESDVVVLEGIGKEDEDVSSIAALETISPTTPSKKRCWCCCCSCCSEPSRSLPERLQLKAAILLGAVVVIIIGSHIPSVISGMSHETPSGFAVFFLHLHYVLYTVNPVLFGFLNKTLRLRAVKIVCNLVNKRDSPPLPNKESRVRKSSVHAAFKRIGRRISQTPLLRDFMDQRRSLADQMEIMKKSDISVLSRKSLIRDEMTLRYFETNL